MWVKWVEVIYEVIPRMCFQKGLDGVTRKGKSIEGREFHKRGTRQTKELRPASVKNELRFSLGD